MKVNWGTSIQWDFIGCLILRFKIEMSVVGLYIKNCLIEFYCLIDLGMRLDHFFSSIPFTNISHWIIKWQLTSDQCFNLIYKSLILHFDIHNSLS